MTRSKGVRPRVSIEEARERVIDAELEHERCKERESEARENTFYYPHHLAEFARETEEALIAARNAREQLNIKLRKQKVRSNDTTR
jgi:hypothetical protein